MKKLNVALILLMFTGLNAFAQSPRIDDIDPLRYCGGSVKTQMNQQDQVSLKFGGDIRERCSQVKVYDARTNKTLRTYNKFPHLSGQTINLNADIMKELSTDCKLTWKILDDYGNVWENFTLTISDCKAPKNKSLKKSKQSGVYYEWSNNHNCKKMVNGEYKGLVNDYYCERVTYEWSNNHNCKKMVGKVYQHNVDASYCEKADAAAAAEALLDLLFGQ